MPENLRGGRQVSPARAKVIREPRSEYDRPPITVWMVVKLVLVFLGAIAHLAYSVDLDH